MKTGKALWATVFTCALAASAGADDVTLRNDPLRFDPETVYTENVLNFQDGRSIRYRLYKNIPYCSKPVDSYFQAMNLYVPETLYAENQNAPIFMRSYAGGGNASDPSANHITYDASGFALLSGFILVNPGSRGGNSYVDKDGKHITIARGQGPDASAIKTGDNPASVVDVKAAIRYIRHNDDIFPGDAEHIFLDGASSGGNLVAVVGATGNNLLYKPYLDAIGAADERDDIFACISFCPMDDSAHQAISYEWLYSVTNFQVRGLSAEQDALSQKLSAEYPAYLASLNLKDPETGIALTADNYLDYLKGKLLQSAQYARNAGAILPTDIGFGIPTIVVHSIDAPDSIEQSEILDSAIDLTRYLNFVASKHKLKTTYDSTYTYPTLDPTAKQLMDLMSATTQLYRGGNAVAPHWYIRQGGLDRDMPFSIPLNLYTRLANMGIDADYRIAWMKYHQGDYDLDGLFAWATDKLMK